MPGRASHAPATLSCSEAFHWLSCLRKAWLGLTHRRCARTDSMVASTSNAGFCEQACKHGAVKFLSHLESIYVVIRQRVWS